LLLQLPLLPPLALLPLLALFSPLSLLRLLRLLPLLLLLTLLPRLPLLALLPLLPLLALLPLLPLPPLLLLLVPLLPAPSAFARAAARHGSCRSTLKNVCFGYLVTDSTCEAASFLTSSVLLCRRAKRSRHVLGHLMRMRAAAPQVG